MQATITDTSDRTGYYFSIQKLRFLLFLNEHTCQRIVSCPGSHQDSLCDRKRSKLNFRHTVGYRNELHITNTEDDIGQSISKVTYRLRIKLF